MTNSRAYSSSTINSAIFKGLPGLFPLLLNSCLGGYGTWELAAIRPEWFAAIMPVCGGGIAAFAQRLAGIPVRAFHGLRDTVVDPAESLQMAKAVNSAGGRAELILFPEAEHNCWDAVYSDESNYDWLLGCSRAEDLPGRE